MKKIIFKWLFISIVCVLLFYIARYLFFRDWVFQDFINNNLNDIKNLVDKNYCLSVLLYMGSIFMLTLLSLPFNGPLAILGGYLYGIVPGMIFTISATTLGTFPFFWLARHFQREKYEKKYKKELKEFDREINKNGLNYLLISRLIPLSPIFVVDILSGLSTISFKTFVIITAIGLLPGSFFYNYTGSKFDDFIDYSNMDKRGLAIYTIIFISFALLPIILKKIHLKNKRKL